MKKFFLLLLVVFLSFVSCSKDSDSTTEEGRFPVAESELTPEKGKLFYLWGDYNDSNFRQYYCLYHYDLNFDLKNYGIDIPTGFNNGFKGSWDGNKKKTVSQRGFSYTFSNSTLSITFSEDKSKEELRIQKTQNRTLKNGDKIYMNEKPYTVQIENTSF